MYCFYDSTDAVTAGPGVKRRVLVHEGKMMLVENTFEKGAIGSMHSHPHEQVTYVLSGVFKFVIDGDERIVKAGDSMHKNPNIVHGCECLEAGVLLDVFSPQRDDFIN